MEFENKVDRDEDSVFPSSALVRPSFCLHFSHDMSQAADCNLNRVIFPEGGGGYFSKFQVGVCREEC